MAIRERGQDSACSRAPAPGRSGPLPDRLRSPARQSRQAPWAAGSCRRQAAGAIRTTSLRRARRMRRARTSRLSSGRCSPSGSPISAMISRSSNPHLPSTRQRSPRCSPSRRILPSRSSSQSEPPRRPGAIAGGNCRSSCRFRATTAKARAFVGSADFAAETGDARFNALFDFLARSNRPAKTARPATKAWASKDKAVNANITDTGRAFTLALKARNASRFGAYITENLEELYRGLQGIGSCKEHRRLIRKRKKPTLTSLSRKASLISLAGSRIAFPRISVKTF